MHTQQQGLRGLVRCTSDYALAPGWRSLPAPRSGDGCGRGGGRSFRMFFTHVRMDFPHLSLGNWRSCASGGNSRRGQLMLSGRGGGR